MYRNDLQRTGYSTSITPDGNNTKWFYNATAQINSSPAVADGIVVVGLSNGKVLAVNSTTGQKIWSYDSGDSTNSMYSSPAIDSGRVYIGAKNNNLYCLNESTGELIWKYLTGNSVQSSPLISNGKVFFGSIDGKVYCLDSRDGTLVWNFNTGGRVYVSPALWSNTIYISSAGNNAFENAKIFAINADIGIKIWDYNTTDLEIDSSPAINYGEVFTASFTGNLYCINATTGSLVWNSTGYLHFVQSAPAVADGKIFVGGDSKFYCFDATAGSLIWSLTASVWSSPAVADGKVLFGTQNGKFYCLDENTGSQIWSYQIDGGSISSSPAISNGTVYVGCSINSINSGGTLNGGLYAFGATDTKQSDLSLSLESQTSFFGFNVNLNGILKSGTTLIDKATILLSYSIAGGQTWNDITTVQTSSDGSYNAVWLPAATGTFLVRASYQGVYPYQSSEASLNLSVIPYNNQYVFAVSSNSTVSALAFDSSSNILTFTVSGPSGTTGFVDMQIAKNLVANIANLKVYLDGNTLDYTATSTANSWLLHYSYSHSTHSITVNLGATVTTTPNPTPSSSPTPIPTSQTTSTPNPTKPNPTTTNNPTPIISPSPTVPEFNNQILAFITIMTLAATSTILINRQKTKK
jgi:outer membrane protein assembly factor BamB